MPGASTVAELAVVVSADTRAAETGLSSLGEKVGGVGGMLATAFTGAAIAGLADLRAGLAASVSAAVDFEKQMSAIAAVSGASASELQALSDAALQLGKDTSFSASEAAAGIEELVKAGVSMSDIMGGAAKASLDLAAAGAISVGEAAEIASNAMNVFGISGADMAHIADVIAGAANASAIGVNDYKFSLAAAGAVAATVGMSFEDLSTAIALMGNAGIKGSDAGTSLKTMLMNLQPGTKKQTELFRELGLITADGANQFFDAQGKMKSLSEVSQVLQDALAGMTDQQKLATLEMLFGSDAVRAAAVVAKAGAEGVDELAASISKVTAAQVAATRLDNLAGAWEQLKGSAETAAITLGMQLMPVLTQLVQWATAGLNAAIPSIEAFGKALAQLFSDVSGVMGDLKAVFMGDAEGNAFTLDKWFPRETTDMVINAIRQIGDAWRTVIEVFTSGWQPSETIDPFVNAVGMIATVFRDQVIPAITEVAAFIVEQFGTVVAWTQENWPLIQETIQTVLAAIAAFWEAHGAQILNTVQVAWEALKVVISTALAVVLDLIKMSMQLINGDWQGAWQTFLSILQTTAQAAGQLLHLFFAGTIEALKTWATGMLEGVKLWGEGQATAVTESLAALLAVFTEGWAGIQAYITETTTAIQTAVMAVWNQIPEDIRADLVLITSHLTEQGAAWLASVQTTVDAIWTAITTKLAEIAAAVMTWASTTIMEPLNNLTNTATQAAEETGTGIWAAITTKLAETVTALRTWADSTFMEPLRRLVSTAGSAAREIGTAIVNGIISGVRSMGDALSGVLASMVRSALQAAKAALDIKSPSKVFSEQVGQPIVQGIMQGLESMSRPLDGALSGLVSAPTLSPSYAMAGGGSMGVGRQDVMVLDFRVDGRTAEKIYVMGRDITISRGQGRR